MLTGSLGSVTPAGPGNPTSASPATSRRCGRTPTWPTSIGWPSSTWASRARSATAAGSAPGSPWTAGWGALRQARPNDCLPVLTSQNRMFCARRKDHQMRSRTALNRPQWGVTWDVHLGYAPRSVLGRVAASWACDLGGWHRPSYAWAWSPVPSLVSASAIWARTSSIQRSISRPGCGAAARGRLSVSGQITVGWAESACLLQRSHVRLGGQVQTRAHQAVPGGPAVLTSRPGAS